MLTRMLQAATIPFDDCLGFENVYDAPYVPLALTKWGIFTHRKPLVAPRSVCS